MGSEHGTHAHIRTSWSCNITDENASPAPLVGSPTHVKSDDFATDCSSVSCPAVHASSTSRPMSLGQKRATSGAHWMWSRVEHAWYAAEAST